MRFDTKIQRSHMKLRVSKKTDTGQNTAISRERQNKRSRIKQGLHLISNKEFNTMQIARIHTQDDARRDRLRFPTTEDIPVQNERNRKVLTSSRFTQAC
jgi:hypothetical protein